MDDGHKVWYCGVDLKYQHGMAFIVRKKVVTHLQKTHLHPDLSETTQHQSFRSKYQPQTTTTRKLNSSMSSLTDFHEGLYILVIQGNLNAKVGLDAYQHCAGTVTQ